MPLLEHASKGPIVATGFPRSPKHHQKSEKGVSVVHKKDLRPRNVKKSKMFCPSFHLQVVLIFVFMYLNQMSW